MPPKKTAKKKIPCNNCLHYVILIVSPLGISVCTKSCATNFCALLHIGKKERDVAQDFTQVELQWVYLCFCLPIIGTESTCPPLLLQIWKSRAKIKQVNKYLQAVLWVLVGLAPPVALVPPVFTITGNRTCFKIGSTQNAKIIVFLKKNQETGGRSDLTGLPEFPIKPGIPGGPVLPC